MPQSLSKLYIHLVFSTKNREPYIYILPIYQKETFSYIAGILNAIECSTITVGGMEDHVHILFCLNRTKNISDVVRLVKANTTKWFKNRFHNDFVWQQGYGAFSVSQSGIEAVKAYIAGQESHHAKRTFQEEYRKFLHVHGITFDEKYVWD